MHPQQHNSSSSSPTHSNLNIPVGEAPTGSAASTNGETALATLLRPGLSGPSEDEANPLREKEVRRAVTVAGGVGLVVGCMRGERGRGRGRMYARANGEGRSMHGCVEVCVGIKADKRLSVTGIMPTALRRIAVRTRRIAGGLGFQTKLRTQRHDPLMLEQFHGGRALHGVALEAFF